MIISHSHKFIFFEAGKTGTTSMEEVFSKYDSYDGEWCGSLNDKKHITPKQAKLLIDNNEWHECFKFSFCRNTWDWVVSQYFFNKFKCPPIEKRPKDFKNFKMKEEDVLYVFNLINEKRGIENKIHLSFQKDFITDDNGSILVDFLGKFENINQDFSRILKILNLEKEELPIRNQSKHSDYKSYYTDKTIDMVKDLFREDIEFFDFKFGE